MVEEEVFLMSSLSSQLTVSLISYSHSSRALNCLPFPDRIQTSRVYGQLYANDELKLCSAAELSSLCANMMTMLQYLQSILIKSSMQIISEGCGQGSPRDFGDCSL